jgi:hypothetical protein
MQAYIKRHWAALIPVLIGIAFSLTAILYAGSEKAEFGDARDYINAAHSFLSGIPYPRISFSQPMFRPPFFPVWMAAIWSVFPNSIFAVKMAQALLHGGTVFVAYRIVYEIRTFPCLPEWPSGISQRKFSPEIFSTLQWSPQSK